MCQRSHLKVTSHNPVLLVNYILIHFCALPLSPSLSPSFFFFPVNSRVYLEVDLRHPALIQQWAEANVEELCYVETRHDISGRSVHTHTASVTWMSSNHFVSI